MPHVYAIRLAYLFHSAQCRTTLPSLWCSSSVKIATTPSLTFYQWLPGSPPKSSARAGLDHLHCKGGRCSRRRRHGFLRGGRGRLVSIPATSLASLWPPFVICILLRLQESFVGFVEFKFFISSFPPSLHIPDIICGWRCQSMGEWTPLERNMNNFFGHISLNVQTMSPFPSSGSNKIA